MARISNINGLEEPKLGYTIEDADLADVTDKQDRQRDRPLRRHRGVRPAEGEGQRHHQGHVLHGTDLDVVSAVENALRSALAKREKHFAFLPTASCVSDSTHAHMSFYNGTIAEGVTTYEIEAVTGATMYLAIINAIADLADDYAANARIVMKKTDYYAMVQALANDSEALFAASPPASWAIRGVSCDAATIPWWATSASTASTTTSARSTRPTRTPRRASTTSWSPPGATADPPEVRLPPGCCRRGGIRPVSSLSALTIGALTLTPTFDPATTEYAVTTSNNTNKVTATPADENAVVEILMGETEIENSSSPAWESGENTLTRHRDERGQRDGVHRDGDEGVRGARMWRDRNRSAGVPAAAAGQRRGAGALLDAARSKARRRGSRTIRTNAQYDLFLLSLAAYYYDNRGMTFGGTYQQAAEENARRMINAFVLELRYAGEDSSEDGETG